MSRTMVFEVYGPDGAYLTYYTARIDAQMHANRVGGTIKTGWR